MHTIRYRNIKVAIWENPSDNGAFFSVTITRSWQDERKDWHDSQSFNAGDLPTLAKAVNDAHSWIAWTLRQRQEPARTRPSTKEHAMSSIENVRFETGRLVITANARAKLNGNDVASGVSRHVRGDWGDLCPEDARENERSLATEGRLLSVYHDRRRVKFYVVTECDRSVTTVLLPEDY